MLLPRLREVYPAQVITTREPGGVAIAEQIREVILDMDNTAMDAKTELLLYIAARRQHLVEKVLPELENGNMVIMDRFIDSSETGLARIAANGEREVNRLDLEKLDMHQRVRQGYLDLAEAEPERIKRIDASQTLEEVVEDTWEIIKSYL